jgi:hypothetical protein
VLTNFCNFHLNENRDQLVLKVIITYALVKNKQTKQTYLQRCVTAYVARKELYDNYSMSIVLGHDARLFFSFSFLI